MTRYLAGRILFFIPALFVITLLAFVINVNAPGDPADRLAGSFTHGGSRDDAAQRAYWHRKLGLDLPVFYVSMQALAMPPDLDSRVRYNRREAARRLIRLCGNAPAVIRFHDRIASAEAALVAHPFMGTEKVAAALTTLGRAYGAEAVRRHLEALHGADQSDMCYTAILQAWEAIENGTTRWKNFVPVIRFHPMNQYHRWLFGDGTTSRGILRGDFGLSYATREPVGRIIGSRMGWSVLLAFFSILLAYLVSIPMGVRAATHRGGLFDRVSAVLLFIFFSMPVFWAGTMLLMTFANPDVLQWLPVGGVRPPQGFPEGASALERMRITLPYLVMPVICYSYGVVAFLSRTLRASMLDVLAQPFIRVARAKGLSQRQVVYGHALRNALLPLITVFANVFPLAIGGSVIIETIFSIPGMGYEAYQAVLNLDYPMITAVFTLTGLVTLTGYLLSDVLYAVADPRITFAAKTK